MFHLAAMGYRLPSEQAKTMHSEVAAETREAPVKTAWLVGLSTYWFSTSYKWFLVLVFLLPGQVAEIIPGGEKSAYWGAIFGLGAIWAIIGPALFGDMSDRTGDRRPFMMLGCVLTLVALTALYFGHAIWALALGYLLLQISDDLATGPYSALIPELVPKPDRGRASGIMGTAMSLSQVFAVGVALVMPESRLGLYVSIGLLNIAGAIVVIRMIGPTHGRKVKSEPFFKGWLSPWKHADFRWVWLTRFFVTLAFYFVVPYVNFYVRDVLPEYSLLGWKIGSATQATGILALTMAVFGAVGAFTTGYLTDRLGRKKVTYLGAFAMATPLAVMAMLPNFVVIWVLTMAVGAGYGAYQAANWAMVSDVLPDAEGRGRDMGIWQMSISSVQVIAGAAGLMVAFGNRLHPNFGYQLLFIFATLAVGIGGFVAKNVKGST